MSRNFNNNIDWFNQPYNITYDFYKEDNEDKDNNNSINSYGSNITSILTPQLSGGVSTNSIVDHIGSSDRLNDWKDFGGKVIDLFGNLKGTTSKSGSGSGTPWGAIAGVAKSGYNAITGHNDKNYSDLEEGIIYPLQGASIGSQF